MAGKAAIQASRFDAFWIEPEKLTLIKDKSSPFYQSRVEDPPQPGLVLSMKTIGFMGSKAIEVFKDGDKLCVLDGRGREIAALEANRQLKKEGKPQIKVSVILKRGTEAELYASQCAANENRRDVSDVTRAQELSKLMSYGKTVEEAGAVIGLDKAHATRILAILDCDAKVQKAVEQGKLPATGAWRLSKFERKEQVKQLDKMIEEAGGKKVKVRRVMKAVREAKGANTVERPSLKEIKAVLVRAENDPNTADLIDVLRWVVSGEKHGNFGEWLDETPPAVEPVKMASPAREAEIASIVAEPDEAVPVEPVLPPIVPDAPQLTPPVANTVLPMPGDAIADLEGLPSADGGFDMVDDSDDDAVDAEDEDDIEELPSAEGE